MSKQTEEERQKHQDLDEAKAVKDTLKPEGTEAIEGEVDYKFCNSGKC